MLGENRRAIQVEVRISLKVSTYGFCFAYVTDACLMEPIVAIVQLAEVHYRQYCADDTKPVHKLIIRKKHYAKSGNRTYWRNACSLLIAVVVQSKPVTEKAIWHEVEGRSFLPLSCQSRTTYRHPAHEIAVPGRGQEHLNNLEGLRYYDKAVMEHKARRAA